MSNLLEKLRELDRLLTILEKRIEALEEAMNK